MRVNISVPDHLAAQARRRRLPVSAICQRAIAAELAAFRAGDRVQPLPGSAMCRQGQQTVIAVYAHPATGEWLWLATDDGRVGSFAAQFWECVPAEGEAQP